MTSLLEVDIFVVETDLRHWIVRSDHLEHEQQFDNSNAAVDAAMHIADQIAAEGHHANVVMQQLNRKSRIIFRCPEAP